jgi:hypothetical protein
MRAWILVSFVAAVCAISFAGNAVTFAWLSAFPENSTRLSELGRKFWGNLAAALALAVASLLSMRRAVLLRKK